MPQPIKLTYAEVVEAGRKAYLAGELSAQGLRPACMYRDDSGRPCVVGAALSTEQAEFIRQAGQNATAISMLIEDGTVSTRANAALPRLQSAHDDWCINLREGKRDKALAAETRLRKLLNIEEAA